MKEDSAISSRETGTTVAVYVEDSEGGYATGAERALLSALLFDGLQSYVRYLSAETLSERSDYSEAYRWVHKADEEDYVFSFESVCDALGINPEYLRLGLANASNSFLATQRRTQSYSY